MKNVRRRFWIKASLSASSFVLLMVTIVWHDWIEIVFRADPDQHSGLVEWLIVAVLALAAITLAVLARIDFRQLRTAAA
jgi:hypothetical protein